MWSRILGVFLLINETQLQQTMPITTEYFVDREKHFYIFLLHTNVTLCLGTFVTLGIGTMFVGYLRHVCGMLKIASYRIEQAMGTESSQDTEVKNEIMICKEIIYAVDIHRKALRSSKSITSTFEGMFFLLLAFGVICLSLNLFRIFQIVSFENDIQELLLRLAIVNAILLYIFLVSYTAQEITDHNNHVFETVYNIPWYMAPLHIQKMILFLLQRGSKTFTLSLGGLFVASLESASTV
ncbi:odorant receptor 43a-like [Harpegnathos saltator]|uniref:odorant receptor 43a-like n=1 Tax=Harpegnathos saltator TaxID=610380 RepID=UPI000DBEED13|nr:odorant receptor 43a-like [Harpegnathos saltator]